MSNRTPALVSYMEIMKQRLGAEEFSAFEAAYEQPRAYGFRVNRLKIPVDDFFSLPTLPFPDRKPVPWSEDGFYYLLNSLRDCAGPGSHPYYHAGLYYLQEPSAMLPAYLLGATPTYEPDITRGERVLDLCAAPGGKTVRIAADMAGRGLLVANDVHPGRVKALMKNLELAGVTHAVVTREDPEALASRFPGYFDRILADAPCSGEGMIRGEPGSARYWQRFGSRSCAVLQKRILSRAAAMLRPGGILVYATCTFAPEENERVIAGFLASQADFRLVEGIRPPGTDPGREEWADAGSGSLPRARRDLARTYRIWPHHAEGEGHFAAVLRKEGPAAPGHAATTPGQAPAARNDGVSMPLPLKEFLRTTLDADLSAWSDRKYYLDSRGEHLSLLPDPCPDLAGLKICKTGWYLGRIRPHGGFEPSHALAMGLPAGTGGNGLSLDMTFDRELIDRYLKGETLQDRRLRSIRGTCLVTVQGYPVGWLCCMDGTGRNRLPAGWQLAR